MSAFGTKRTSIVEPPSSVLGLKTGAAAARSPRGKPTSSSMSLTRPQARRGWSEATRSTTGRASPAAPSSVSGPMALTPSVLCRDSRQTSTGSPAEACCPRWCDKPGTSTHSLQSDYRPYRILDFDRSEVAAAVRISPASPPTPPLRSGP